MKKVLMLLVIGLMMGCLVACSEDKPSEDETNIDINTVMQTKSYEEQVRDFINDFIKVGNAQEFDKFFDYTSQAYIDVVNEKLGYTEMKSNLRKSFININAKNFRLVSLEVVTYADEYRVYAATIGYDRSGDLNYDEYIMLIFKEGDKIVYAEQYKTYTALQLAEEKYDYSSPIEGYAPLDKDDEGAESSEGSSNSSEPEENIVTEFEGNASSELESTLGGINEVSAEYEGLIESFKSQDGGRILLNTLYVKVGENVTPRAATVWKDCVIYSQDTAIAKADGNIITGISKGTVYVVIESALGMTDVYKIVVE